MNPSYIKEVLINGGKLLYQEVCRFLHRPGFYRKLKRFRFSDENKTLEMIPSLSDFINPLYLAALLYVFLIVTFIPLLDPRRVGRFVIILLTMGLITVWVTGWMYANEDILGTWLLELSKKAVDNINPEAIKEAVKDKVEHAGQFVKETVKEKVKHASEAVKETVGQFVNEVREEL